MRVVDLFCGAGGLSLGLQKAGLEIVGAVDNWHAAVEVYRRNINGHVTRADIRDVVHLAPWVMDRSPDVVVGGPPCQDFSAAGKQVEGDRAELTTTFAMIIAITRPEWFLFENVARAKQSANWELSRTILRKAGYGITEMVVDSSHFGVGQARKRLIAIGRLQEADDFLAKELGAAKQRRRTTVRDVLGKELSAEYFFMRPFGRGRGVRSIDAPAPAIVRTSREPPTRGYLAAPSSLDPVPANEVHVLTQRQVALLQGFPESWDWSGVRAKRDVDQLLVNAVPVELARSLGELVLARHRGASLPPDDEAFSNWLRAQGYQGQFLRNRRHALRRARRLLGGRVFADVAVELRALEASDEFAKLHPSTRSDLRAAIREYAAWRAKS